MLWRDTAGKVAACNGTGQGKYYIRTPYPEVREAFQNLGKHEEAEIHRPAQLSARQLDELLKRQLLARYILKIKGGA